MKKADSKKSDEVHEMKTEYDFSGATRGRYREMLQNGYSVTIHKEDGSTEDRKYVVEDGAVVLDPDVREYFPDSESVNKALRSLITLIPTKPPRKRQRA